jgi:diguanylate cyclase
VGDGDGSRDVASAQPAPATPSGRHGRRLASRVHPYRTIGMAMGGIAIAAVLYEQGSSAAAWTLLAATTLAWPQLALFVARRSADPYAAEQRNLVIDSMIAAAWVPLMHFNLLPSLLLVIVAAADKMDTDVPGLLRRTILPSLAAALVAGLATGFAFHPYSSLAVQLACVPILLIHTIGVATGRRRLVRRLRLSHQALDRLSRFDPLTGVGLRGRWERDAEAALLQHVGPGAPPATLWMIDVDGLKQANDRHGHTTGDALLRAVGEALRDVLHEGDIAGRYGGDEFGVVTPGDLAGARARAEAFRAAVAGMRLEEAPDIACSVSIGLAAAAPGMARIEDWVAVADAALYEAKRGGRDRVVAHVAGPAPLSMA